MHRHPPRPFSVLKRQLFVVALVPALLVSGCAGKARDGFPSLLPRAAENLPATPVITAPVVPSDEAATAAALRPLVDRARAANDAFADAATRADAIVAEASGAPVGDERWLSAQVAIGAMDSLRGDTAAALASLDDLAISRAARGEAPSTLVAQAQRDVSAMLTAQTARIIALQATLPAR